MPQESLYGLGTGNNGQPTPFQARARGGELVRGFRGGNRKCKPKPAALTQLAFQADFSLHECYQTFRNGQPQTRSPILSRGGTIGLCERLEQGPLGFMG